MRPLALGLLAALAGCAPRAVLPLAAAGTPLVATPLPEIPLEVAAAAIAVPDPLPVDGARVAWSGVDPALALAVASATAPWAEAHRGSPKVASGGGWRLAVELTRAVVQRRRGPRTLVSLEARATLRGRGDGVFRAQTNALCRAAAPVEADAAAPVMQACMQSLGRQLAAWLAAVEP
jgi:hypothetical protein